MVPFRRTSIVESVLLFHSLDALLAFQQKKKKKKAKPKPHITFCTITEIN